MSTTTTARGLNPDQWIDRTETSKLAGCSVDTVKRHQKRHVLDTRTAPNGATTMRLGDLVDTQLVPSSVLDADISAREVAQAVHVRHDLGRLREEHAALQGRHQAQQDVESLLRAHIATLNDLVTALRVGLKQVA